MSNPNYYSFLICRHETHTDFYFTGRQIGVLRNGEFKIHEVVMPDGSKRELTIRDMPQPCPFESLAELRHEIEKLVSTMPGRPTP
jgi:hypothetical protein